MAEKPSQGSLGGIVFAVAFMTFMVGASIVSGGSDPAAPFLTLFMVIMWLGMVLLLISQVRKRFWPAKQPAAPPPAKAGYGEQNSIIPLIFVVVGIAVLIPVFLLSSSIAPNERFWSTVVFSLFGLVAVVAILGVLLMRRMGRAMRARSAATPAAVAAMPADAPAPEGLSLPPPPRHFEYRIFDVNSATALSAKAESLRQRARTLYKEFVGNLMATAFMLWPLYLGLAMIGLVVRTPTSVRLDIWLLSSAALLAGLVVANPNRYVTGWTAFFWMVLNVVWFGLIVFTLLDTAVRWLAAPNPGAAYFGPVLVILLAGGILILYGWLFRHLSIQLKRRAQAAKPLKLLVLWVFGVTGNIMPVLMGIGVQWRYIGSLRFLRGGAYTVDMSDLGAFFPGRGDKLIVETAKELEQRLASFKDTPDWSGAYPANTLLCGDAVWKQAVNALLDDSDAVAMSLCGFSEQNQGCLYELGLLLDCFPTRRVLFLFDGTTDLDFLLTRLSEKWDALAAGSPNRSADASPVRLYRLGSRLDNPLLLSQAMEGQYVPRPSTIQTLPGGIEVKVETPGIVQAYQMFSQVQTATNLEVDMLVRLIFEGAAGDEV